MDESLPRPAASPRGRQLAWLVALALPPLVAPLWVRLFGGLPRVGTAPGMVLVLLVTACSYTDLRWRKIPNWATYPAFLWGLALHAVPGLGPPADDPPLTFGESLLGAAVCFGLMFLLYRLVGGGAGDVKLVAAVGALVGVERGFEILLASYLLAGFVIVSWLLWRHGPLFLLGNLARKAGAILLPTWVAPPSPEAKAVLTQPVPLAAFFAAGSFVVLLGWEPRW